MKNVQVTKTVRIAAAAALAVASGVSQAAIDTSEALTELTGVATAVGVIGAAVLGVVVIIKAFKFVRSAF